MELIRINSFGMWYLTVTILYWKTPSTSWEISTAFCTPAVTTRITGERSLHTHKKPKKQIILIKHDWFAFNRFLSRNESRDIASIIGAIPIKLAYLHNHNFINFQRLVNQFNWVNKEIFLEIWYQKVRHEESHTNQHCMRSYRKETPSFLHGTL